MIDVWSQKFTVFGKDIIKGYAEFSKAWLKTRYGSDSNYRALIVLDGDVDIRKGDRIAEGVIKDTLEDYHSKGGTFFTVSEVTHYGISGKILTTEILC